MSKLKIGIICKFSTRAAMKMAKVGRSIMMRVVLWLTICQKLGNSWKKRTVPYTTYFRSKNHHSVVPPWMDRFRPCVEKIRAEWVG